MEGFDLSREHNLWQILPANGTLVLATKHPHPGAALVTHRMLTHANAVDVDIFVADHTGIVVKTINISRHPVVAGINNSPSILFTLPRKYSTLFKLLSKVSVWIKAFSMLIFFVQMLINEVYLHNTLAPKKKKKRNII